MAKSPGSSLNFDVSTRLKSVLGGELISSDNIAIFELVKNSFDAFAKNVDVYFGEDEIVITDDGHGMSYKDLKDKWLFVAYSAKRGTGSTVDFRDQIADRRHLAGSKGIGRFSTDRLGEVIQLQTRAANETQKSKIIHNVTIDWAKFESNPLEKFETIGVDYEERRSFALPPGVNALTHGTSISVQKLRKVWTRTDMLELKAELAKLINPFGDTSDGFSITFSAPKERLNDKAVSGDFDGDDRLQRIVNGKIGNFVFRSLEKKTTYLEISLGDGGLTLETTLLDRGELIYRISQPNPYPKLASAGFKCRLFFLNRSAKTTFTRRMGIRSVSFGSVFVFRNNFRVYPIGNEGDDWFQMDRRKSQGHSRYLGTRDLIGRIDLSGEDDDFQEASSRDTGFIQSEAVSQLQTCFMEHCLKRIERYVVPVTFKDKEDKNFDDLTRIKTDAGRTRIAQALAKLVGDKDITLLEYNTDLVQIVDEKSAHFEESIDSLRTIANKLGDKKFDRRINDAERRFRELSQAKESALAQADEERRAKERAQARADEAERLAAKRETELEEERKRNNFLASISTLDMDTVLNLHHQITIYSVDILQQIENFFLDNSVKKTIPRDIVVVELGSVAMAIKRIQGIAKWATRANFRLQSEHIETPLGAYIKEYVETVAIDFLPKPFTAQVTLDKSEMTSKFRPIDVAIMVDNLISNARRANAFEITFEITHPEEGSLHILVEDDGSGFDKKIPDLERVFEKGFTLTEGSGLGLFHVSQVLSDLNGTIEPIRDADQPKHRFMIRIST
jgi:hypothetical protein